MFTKENVNLYDPNEPSQRGEKIYVVGERFFASKLGRRNIQLTSKVEENQVNGERCYITSQLKHQRQKKRKIRFFKEEKRKKVKLLGF